MSPSGTPLVELCDVSKRFDEHLVLDRVSLQVRAGEVHVLAGENGAGKSTIVKILAGIYGDYSGSMLLEDGPVRFAGPIDARRAGIAVIHQELSLVPAMTVADNVLLGREPCGPLAMLRRRLRDEQARRALESVGLSLSTDAIVEDLPLATRQLVEIAKAMGSDARVLIMDEPTSALSAPQARVLFERIAALRQQGYAFVFITHRLEEVYRIADRITVLRDGRVLECAPAGELGPARLVALLAAGSERSAPAAGVEPGDVVLEVAGLSLELQGRAGSPELCDVSLAVRRGEILGLAGLQGAGNSLLLHAVFGALGDRVRGRVRLCGKSFAPESPAASLARGVVLLPADRATTGLLRNLDVTSNATLASLDRFSPNGWLRPAREHDAVAAVAAELRLDAPSLTASVADLSGGNQQKLLLARCLLCAPALLLLDDPTRGVDIAAKADIHGVLRRLASSGTAILLVSAELDELLALSDRVAVLHRGRLVAELRGEALTRERVIAAALGHDEAA